MFNEASRLRRTLPSLVALADLEEVEVIVVDDGSTDESCGLFAEHEAHPRLHLHSQPRNLGKGAAVRRGVQESRGRTIVFMDADLATDLGSLGPLLAALDDADVAIGSRAHEGSVLHDTTSKRSRRGGRFNQMVRGVTGLPFRDTQCGFKGFTAPAAKALLASGRIDGFAFDVELLLLARSYGMKVAEVPVQWTEIRGSKVRPIADPILMAGAVVRTSLSSQLRRAVRVPTIEIVAQPGRARVVADVVSRCVRAGDLVSHDGATVYVALPFATSAQSVVDRLAHIDAMRDMVANFSLKTRSLPELLRNDATPAPITLTSAPRATAASWTARLGVGT